MSLVKKFLIKRQVPESSHRMGCLECVLLSGPLKIGVNSYFCLKYEADKLKQIKT